MQAIVKDVARLISCEREHQQPECGMEVILWGTMAVEELVWHLYKMDEESQGSLEHEQDEQREANFLRRKSIISKE
jgi:hypothetical protein